jgi:hypothetical protein
MTIEPNDLQSRLRILLGLQSEVFTDEELSQTAGCYARCPGKENWAVREYARRTGVGAREYRVVRGSSIEHVYRSAERGRAAAVGSALNQLESQEKSGELHEEARKSAAAAARSGAPSGSLPVRTRDR